MVPGSTLDHVVFFADDGTAYTMRDQRGARQFRLRRADHQVLQAGRPGAKSSTRRRPTRASSTARPSRRARKTRRGRTCFVATSGGYTLPGCRSPRIAQHRPRRAGCSRVSTKARSVVLAKVLGQYRWVDGKRTKIDEETMFLVSTEGHVIHFPIDEVNVLSGAGKGVIGIKLHDDDKCIGGALVHGRFTKMDVETSGGITQEFGGGIPTVSRGGTGRQDSEAHAVCEHHPAADRVDGLGSDRVAGREERQAAREEREEERRAI